MILKIMDTSAEEIAGKRKLLTMGLNESTFTYLAPKWAKLGVGYSPYSLNIKDLPEVDPEETLLESLPHLLNDFHMFGLVLACLQTFSRFFRPDRILEILPNDLDPKSTLTLHLLAKNLTSLHPGWEKVYVKTHLPGETLNKISTGEIDIWENPETKRTINLMRLLVPQDKEFTPFNIYIPELTPANPKKISPFHYVLENNKTYQKRI